MPESENQRPRLGELLINRGLITREQLDESLTVSHESGEPLGHVLVERGLVPAHVIAMALADQHGGPLKTEFGFATGSASDRSTPEAAGETPLPPVLRLAPIGAAPEPVSTPAAPEPETTTAAVVSEQLEAETASRLRAEARANELLARVEELQAELEELTTVAPAHADVEQLRAVIELQEQALAAAAARERARDGDARLVVEPSSARTYSNDRHFLFAAGAEGYELLERSGPPPSPGELVELSGGGKYQVVRVGPAPFPGAPEACAYLELV